MLSNLHHAIITAAQPYYTSDDPSHDFQHINRVLNNALCIHAQEEGDLDIIVAAVAFHDAINYPKNHPKAACATQESCDVAAKELQKIAGYPQEKIAAVQTCILEHSFSAGLKATSLESQIVQDADRLEATGALSIMRTFASTGQMKRPFYHAEDPFCSAREPDPKQCALDLFFVRLLKVEGMMNTQTARNLAQTRTEFLYSFLDNFGQEIGIPYHQKLTLGPS